jgi:hypothetical protein
VTVFEKRESGNRIIDIDNRGGVYKKKLRRKS